MKEAFTEQLFTSSQVLKAVNITYRQLSYWELKGIIKPVLQKQGTRDFKHYTQKDIDTLKRVKNLLDEGYSLPTTDSLNEIAKRKELEDKLKKSEKSYRDLFDNANDIILSVDAQGNIVYFNRILSELTGYSKDELKSMNILEDLISPDFRSRTNKYLTRLIKCEDIKNMPQCFIKKDKQRLYLEVNSTAVCDENGNFLRTRCILRDITERKQAEETLQQSEANYRELADSITDVFFAMDKDLRYTYWNRASEELTGVKAKDAIGKSIFEIFPDREDTRKAVTVYREVLKTQQPRNFVNEYQLKNKNFFFEISAYPSKDGLSVLVKDITERKHAAKIGESV